MYDAFQVKNQTHYVTNFYDLVSTPNNDGINAICWTRKLIGDFSEIVDKLEADENIVVLDEGMLLELHLSEQGNLAREIVINDLNLLKEQGASPALNLLTCYERDAGNPVFPTDVYSYHVDRSPVPTYTYLCTYYGEPSEILPNSQAEQKILVPEIRNELRKLFQGGDEEFEAFLSKHFYDLHYQPKPDAKPISLGLGNLWRLTVDHPECKVLPCIHRAPKEKPGEKRLLLIC